MQSQRIVLTQKQQLKLSPQMYQSLELLALPIIDLQARIQDEIERNPALELTSPSDLSYEKYSDSKDTTTFELFENSSDPGFVRKATTIDPDSKHQFIEGALSGEKTLQAHLVEQLHLADLDEREMELGELLISNLDHHGFYVEDPYAITEGYEKSQVDLMLQTIREFDPPGVCVRDYMESLLLQCHLDPIAMPYSQQIIENHLEEVRRGKTEEIAKALGIPVEEVEDAIWYIKTLNPYPGSTFASDQTQYIIPDIIVTMDKGRLVMRLNNDQIPSLSIDPEFEQMSEDPEVKKEKETAKFVQQRLGDARWLIQSIQMRNSTLRKVGSALIRAQVDFFTKGPKYLRPLTLKDIAQEVEVHETTISRISNAKYIQSDFGIFPIKYFFTNAVSGTSDDGKEISKIGVKEVIRELIENYDGKKRLSDQKISDMLETRGISIARRTVAKYRKELNIDSSFDRS